MRIVIAAVFIAFVISALTSAIRKDVNDGFDELAHLSYVAQVEEQNGPVRLEKLRMLDAHSLKFTANPSYLNHADPYYRLLAIVGPKIEGHPENLIWDRAINIVMVTLGFALMLVAMIKLAISEEEMLIFAAGMACIPVLPQLAGSVNNDNLAFLGGAVVIFGVQRFLTENRSTDLLIAGIGVVVAGAAKLTALMLCGGFLGLVIAIAWFRGAAQWRHIAIVALALLIACVPCIGLWMTYGSPAPNTPGQIDMLVDGARLSGWATQPRLGPVAYIWAFSKAFVTGWMPALTDRSAFHNVLLVIPLGTLCMAAAGVVQSLRVILKTSDPDSYAVIVCAGAGAIVATMIVHIGFSYQRHLATGWMMDAFPRYYLPLIEIVPLAAIGFFRNLRRDRYRELTAGFLLLSPFVFRLLG